MLETLVNIVGLLLVFIAVLGASVLGIQFINQASRNMSTTNAGVAGELGKWLKQDKSANSG